MTKMF